MRIRKERDSSSIIGGPKEQGSLRFFVFLTLDREIVGDISCPLAAAQDLLSLG